jgi:hypothetical protein
VALPTPAAGLVIRYAYLWANEYEAGAAEGVKDRPAAVILAHETEEGRTIAVVLPITHSPPSAGSAAVEIPQATKRRLGLDSERSWIVTDEANVFSGRVQTCAPRAAKSRQASRSECCPPSSRQLFAMRLLNR